MRFEKCLIGLGSPHGDDQIGWQIADSLRPELPSDVVVRKAQSPMEILNWIDDLQWLGICDACSGLMSPGHWKCWTWPDPELSGIPFSGTHDFGLSSVLELADRLGRLPATVQIWGIEIADCRVGLEISVPVQQSIPGVMASIGQQLAMPQRGSGLWKEHPAERALLRNPYSPGIVVPASVQTRDNGLSSGSR